MPLAERFRPAGNVPEVRLHVKGAVPPVRSVLRSKEYATPKVAGGRASF